MRNRIGYKNYEEDDDDDYFDDDCELPHFDKMETHVVKPEEEEEEDDDDYEEYESKTLLELKITIWKLNLEFSIYY